MKLIIVLITLGFNLYKIQAELEAKSEIRFGYGMLFDYHGQKLHGLNRYNLMVGLKIPSFDMADYYVPTKNDKNANYCDRFKNYASTICNL